MPQAGDEFRVRADERDARSLAEDRALRERLAEQQRNHMTLDKLFERMNEGETTELNLIVKADVQGSIEALKDALDKMDQSEVKINVIHSAVGGITETDVSLAEASDAIIIGFGVRPQPRPVRLPRRTGRHPHLSRNLSRQSRTSTPHASAMLSPDIIEETPALPESASCSACRRPAFIAGAYVTDGEIGTRHRVRNRTDDTVVFEADRFAAPFQRRREEREVRI